MKIVFMSLGIILAIYTFTVWVLHIIFTARNHKKFKDNSSQIFYLLFGLYDIGLSREWHKHFKEKYHSELEKDRKFFARTVIIFIIAFFTMIILGITSSLFS